jgi:hypothetical protein
MNRNLMLPVVVAAVSVFSLTAIFPAALAEDNNSSGLFGDNETSSMNTTGSTMNETSTTAFIMDNGTLDCQAIAKELGGIGVPNGKVCDVVVVRQAPQITGHNGLNLNQFTLMNSVLEFLAVPDNTTTSSTMTADNNNMSSSNNNTGLFDNSTSPSSLYGNNDMSSSNMTGNSTTGTAASSQQIYVMGDFALLETEMNDVLTVVKDNGWTVTGVHNHMINEMPKLSFMHWETQGDINEIIDQANQAFEKTSIKG